MLESTTISVRLQALRADRARQCATHLLVYEAAEQAQASVLSEEWLKELEAAAKAQWMRLTEGN
jgi:GTPase SAR1 family protein